MFDGEPGFALCGFVAADDLFYEGAQDGFQILFVQLVLDELPLSEVVLLHYDSFGFPQRLHTLLVGWHRSGCQEEDTSSSRPSSIGQCEFGHNKRGVQEIEMEFSRAIS